jgi:Beta-Casp domain
LAKRGVDLYHSQVRGRWGNTDYPFACLRSDGIEATEIYCWNAEEHDLEIAALRNEDRNPISSRHLTVHRLPVDSKSSNNLKGPLMIILSSDMATGG